MVFLNKSGINKRWRLYATGAFVAMLVVNGLAGGTTLLGGVDTAAVSDSFPNLFAPAGVTFAIWGVIYSLLLVHLMWQFGLPGRQTKASVAATNDILPLFTASSVLNFAWIFAWQYQVLWLSVILMLGLLTTLIMIVRRLSAERYSRREWLFVRAPFSVYFGWITVATIANITTWLVSINWDGAGYSDGTWMVAVLLVGAIIGIATAVRNYDWVYLAVFIWAYAGILLKHLSPDAFNGSYPSTIVTITILLPVFIVTSLALFLRIIPTKRRIVS